MPQSMHCLSVLTLADLEAICRTWRTLGAVDGTKVTIDQDFCYDVTATLLKHHTTGEISVSFEKFYQA